MFIFIFFVFIFFNYYIKVFFIFFIFLYIFFISSTCALLSCRCMCSSGYTGQNCESDYIPCDPSPCENGGSCRQTSELGYECQCPEGEYFFFTFYRAIKSRSYSPKPSERWNFFVSTRTISSRIYFAPLFFPRSRSRRHMITALSRLTKINE